ncbi:MAG: TetR/AcrR family transcriptional regulator [Syntrophomonadaceae bacterium]|nr:TetR/AcrR family transcriptional regulator [Syntrophomonadaceae bacterium]
MQARIKQIARREIKRFGLRRFTMDDVAAQLGISKKTLYKFFLSKGELIHAVLSDDLQKDKEMLLEAIANEGNWFDQLSATLSFAAQNQISNDLWDEIRMYFPEEEKEINEFLAFQKEQIGLLLEEGLSKGEIEPWFDLDNLLTIIIGLIRISKLQMEADPESSESPNLMEDIKKLIFFGLIKRTW